jgi:hypothetical protein
MEYTKFAKSVNGFVTMTATPKQLSIRFVDVSGAEMYSTMKTK